MQGLDECDLAFTLDITGSMSGFIETAKRQLIEVIRAVSGADVDLRVGVVTYSDHPPQDHFLTGVYPFESDLAKMNKQIQGITLKSGGDGPEAVYQGLNDAIKKLQWRKHAMKFIVLVGDSPPHAFKKWAQEFTPWDAVNDLGDHFREGCPSKHNPNSISALAEDHGIVIHSIVMGGQRETTLAFSAICAKTGGQCHSSRDGSKVIDLMAKAVGAEMKKLDFDRKVFEEIQYQMQTKGMDYEDAVAFAGTTHGSYRVSSSLGRLSSRGIKHKD